MATLLVVITGCEVKKGKGDYFVMCQLDQASNEEAKIPSGNQSIKRKTDICKGSEYPQFSVNTLTYDNVIIFSSLSLKVGLFEIVKDTVILLYI